MNKELLEMARVGFVMVGKSPKFEVYVNTNDAGRIPHFHFRDAVNLEEFNSCIRIDRADYFNHGNYKDTLNSEQRESLERFMRSPVGLDKYRGKFENNWELTCFLWDINNSVVQIPDGITQPDYNKL